MKSRKQWKKSRKQGKKSQKKGKKTRKQKGGDMTSILAATAVGAGLLWGASKLTRSVRNREPRGRSLEEIQLAYTTASGKKTKSNAAQRAAAQNAAENAAAERAAAENAAAERAAAERAAAERAAAERVAAERVANAAARRYAEEDEAYSGSETESEAGSDKEEAMPNVARVAEEAERNAAAEINAAAAARAARAAERPAIETLYIGDVVFYKNKRLDLETGVIVNKTSKFYMIDVKGTIYQVTQLNIVGVQIDKLNGYGYIKLDDVVYECIYNRVLSYMTPKGFFRFPSKLKITNNTLYIPVKDTTLEKGEYMKKIKEQLDKQKREKKNYNNVTITKDTKVVTRYDIDKAKVGTVVSENKQKFHTIKYNDENEYYVHVSNIVGVPHDNPQQNDNVLYEHDGRIKKGFVIINAGNITINGSNVSRGDIYKILAKEEEEEEAILLVAQPANAAAPAEEEEILLVAQPARAAARAAARANAERAARAAAVANAERAANAEIEEAAANAEREEAAAARAAAPEPAEGAAGEEERPAGENEAARLANAAKARAAKARAAIAAAEIEAQEVIRGRRAARAGSRRPRENAANREIAAQRAAAARAGSRRPRENAANRENAAQRAAAERPAGENEAARAANANATTRKIAATKIQRGIKTRTARAENANAARAAEVEAELAKKLAAAAAATPNNYENNEDENLYGNVLVSRQEQDQEEHEKMQQIVLDVEKFLEQARANANAASAANVARLANEAARKIQRGIQSYRRFKTPRNAARVAKAARANANVASAANVAANAQSRRAAEGAPSNAVNARRAASRRAQKKANAPAAIAASKPAGTYLQLTENLDKGKPPIWRS